MKPPLGFISISAGSTLKKRSSGSHFLLITQSVPMSWCTKTKQKPQRGQNWEDNLALGGSTPGVMTAVADRVLMIHGRKEGTEAGRCATCYLEASLSEQWKMTQKVYSFFFKFISTFSCVQVQGKSCYYTTVRLKSCMFIRVYERRCDTWDLKPSSVWDSILLLPLHQPRPHWQH